MSNTGYLGKPFALCYNEQQGMFHHEYSEPQHKWEPLLLIDSDYMNSVQHSFTHLMRVYNAPDGWQIQATFKQVIECLRLYLHTNKILFTAQELPQQPGVYIVYDKYKNPIYVGKSGNLKARLPKSVSQRHGEYFSFSVTNTEADANIYEMYFMHTLQPILNRSKWISIDAPTIKIDEIEFTELVHKSHIGLT